MMLPKTILALALAAVPAATLAQTGSAPLPVPFPNSPQTAPQAGGQAGAANPQQQGELVVDVVGGVSAPLGIAIPVMPTSEAVSTAAGRTDELGRQLSDIVTTDLRNSGLFKPLGGDALHPIAYPEVTAPTFDYWGPAGASALVQGFVRANGDGTLTVGCYLYDVSSRAEIARQGFVVPPSEWRRAGHKCADMVYSKLTGEGPYFDSRVVYISETGPKGKRIKRLAIMDQDGGNHRFLTNGQAISLTPRFSPDQRSIVYMSYLKDRPAIYVYDLASGSSRLLVASANLTFAPRISPDGRFVLFSMAVGGNTDIYRVAFTGGSPQRLTDSPGIDTGATYSPDGGRIVFESDRSGTQQLYVMNADGSSQQRISFGSGRYATPVWSPRGNLIAYTKIGGSFRIGVMSPAGGNEQLLTDGAQDEGPSWSPNGRVIMFFRSGMGGGGRADLWSVDLTGVNVRRVPTVLDGSDPAWGPLRP
ncbi:MULTISPECIES: Tol-Pal system beta propeller repeat protein TolB [unclassified Sphingomonas]|uniref:Tol-Pal system beta propeller repeat protein TolB n=1 Tax=unclassified Sphingomonas TaxID=196159 RepID=UPI002AB39771|nr:Tol-Pal system beta propeller repeat protein TolB [Sphingomonas sp. 10B4]MDY7524457.1 Tol-Pal system beta propeller repeat protein TolB [Sphingomonas sp. 10B4]MEB0283060.1 Tol-Pal system beta propeller repeat protein TolB [Sphingomonas sp. 10B4]